MQFFERVVRESLNEKLICEQRPEEGEGVTHVIIWGERIQAKETGSAKSLRQEGA